MKVKMLTSIASADWAHKPGDVVDLPDGEALCLANLAEMVAEGKAVPVKSQRKRKATKRGREKAAFK